MVVAAMSEEGGYFQRGLSEWWTEESEYFLQRIEKWTAMARGYNRLKSQKLSLTSEFDESCKNQESPETRRIKCCGGFNYQSNSKLDSNCLETYQYDHSIYFKTIGDIRRSKSTDNVSKKERISTESMNDEEQIEWDIRAIDSSSPNGGEPLIVTPNGDVRWDYLESADPEINQLIHNVWPIVDITSINDSDQLNNNVHTVSKNKWKTQDLKFTRFLSFRRSRRSSKFVRHPKIFGDNNVSWPGVLLSYKQANMDPALSASHNRMLNVK